MSLTELLLKLNELNIHIKLENEDLNIKAAKGKLTPELVKELKEKKEELIKFLKGYVSIEKSKNQEFYPLSSAQNRLFVLSKIPSTVLLCT